MTGSDLDGDHSRSVVVGRSSGLAVSSPSPGVIEDLVCIAAGIEKVLA